ncbi:MAG: chromosomal replication initiator protein DnaA [Eubacteriales bacterium]|nr:chromosomal replication initiator protein DnaA [Eubacteriales bacterium]
MNDLNEIWDSVLRQMAEEISAVSFETWIKSAEPIEIRGNELVLSVGNSLNKQMLMTKFRSMIESCIELETGRTFEINVVVNENAAAKTEGEFSTEDTASSLNPRYSFENFVVGGNNNLAYAAALGVAESPGRKYNPLFLYGGSGLGKTHLLQAIGNKFHQLHPERKVLYTTSEKFTYELVTAIREKSNQEFRRKYRTVDLLLVDDVQFLATKEVTQEEFFHTFNAIYDAGNQIVLTSDRLPSETPHLTDRIKGRFSMGLLADVQPPDYETRLAILRAKIEEEYFTFDEEIIEYVANNIRSNVRDLEGAVKRILAYAGIERTNTISIELAQKALKEIISTLPKRNITISVIIDEVEKYYHLPQGSLITKKRSNDVAYPRHIAMYLAREVLNESYPRIGEEFNRDHSTVMNAVKKVKANLSGDRELAEKLEDLVNNIRKN